MVNVSGSSNEFSLEKWSLFLEKTVFDNNELIYPISLTLMGITFVTSLVGNLITCSIICYDKSMHTTTNYYLLNLAVSDLIMTFTMLLEILETQTNQNSLILCKIQWFIIVCLWNNGILTMAALAIERYVAIWHPFKSMPTSSWKRVGKIIVLLWMVAIAETVLELQTVGLVKVRQMTMCFTIPTPWARIVNGVLGVVTFVIPLIIMIVAHSTIVYKVIASQMGHAKDTIFNQQDPTRKISKLVILITVSFVMCGMPFFIARITLCVLNVDQLLNLPVSWGTWSCIIIINGWVSVVSNPILYSLASTKFRKAAKNIYNEKIRRINS